MSIRGKAAGAATSARGKAPVRRDLCGLLGCRHPILQAGMGGVARAELVAAVGEAGGFGFLGMVRESPELIAEEIAAVKAASSAPFGVNLIPAATDRSLLADELSVCFDLEVPVLCFFWDVVPKVVELAKDAGCIVAYQVGSVADAIAAERAGADIIIAQGLEAGGHVRGQVSSLVLLPQVVAAVTRPVVASGGFASGESLAAALALGAQGIHCGTAFLATRESFAHNYHKERVLAAGSEDTIHTDAFGINWPPGSPVRVLANALTEALEGKLLGHDPEAIRRVAIAEEDGRPIYRYSTDSPLRSTRGDLESLALFAGQVAGSLTSLPSAAERINDMLADAQATLQRLGRLAEQPALSQENPITAELKEVLS